MKGMQKIKRGTGFRPLSDYCLSHDGGKVIGGNMSGTTARELSAEFKAGRMQRPDIGKPVWHNSLRLQKGEHLTDEQWQAVVQDYMRELGFKDDHQYCIIKHDHPDGEHVHIIANRVSLLGEVYLGKNENLISTKIISGLEAKHGLAITKSVDPDNQTKTSKRKPKAGEVEKALHTLQKPPRIIIQNEIDRALTDCTSLGDLTDRLAEKLITVKKFISDDGDVKGLSFSMCDGKNEVKFSGSQLGDAYKYQSIKAQLIKNQEIKNDETRPNKSVANTSRTGRPVGIQAPGSSKNQGNCIGAQRPAHPHPSPVGGFGYPENRGIQKDKQALLKLRGVPPFMNIKPRPPSALDLAYLSDGADAAPVMRWHQDRSRLDVLRDDCETILHALKIARASGMPEPLRVFGTREFQQRAAEVALENGITVAPTDQTVARDYKNAVRQNVIDRMEVAAAAREQSARETIQAQAAREESQRRKALEMCVAMEERKPGHHHFK